MVGATSGKTPSFPTSILKYNALHDKVSLHGNTLFNNHLTVISQIGCDSDDEDVPVPRKKAKQEIKTESTAVQRGSGAAQRSTSSAQDIAAAQRAAHLASSSA